MHSAFTRTDHRPWPHPARRWQWRQSWRDLLFAHWPVPAAAIRPLVPPELEVQEFDGTSWLALVPFRMAGVMRRPFPDVPGISAFPELNVRVYVEHDGRPGVWFLSLDATKRLAVWGARRYFHLPYFLAQIAIREEGAGFTYRSQRREDPRPAVFDAVYRPTSDVYESAPGTLEHWLTERYCLYAQDPAGGLYRAEVHHVPWPLQRAACEIRENTMAAVHGLTADEPPALLHFARRIDVVVWNPEPL